MVLKLGIVAFTVLACSWATVPQCSCPRVVRPVCGSDGRQYSNECDARCNNVDVARPGRCLGVLVARPRCICTLRKKPVCGSDGKTYRNDCLLNCATQYNSKLGIAYYGPCFTNNNEQPECKCPDNHSPVCGSDGVTYDNDCWLNCATAHDSRLSIAQSGFCQDDKGEENDDNSQPECTCPDKHSPVCGSDGVTYDNDCWLNCATAHNSRLSIAHEGFCRGDSVVDPNTGNNPQPECTCVENHSPVCGSDGVTYDNDCWLNCATVYNSRLSVAHSGFCDSDGGNTDNIKQPECICDDNHNPVCGSDGVTYDNDCWLNCATIHDSKLSIAHSGFCPEQSQPDQNSCTCTRNYKPVCGTDGVTYNNACLLRCAGAEKARDGQCEARG